MRPAADSLREIRRVEGIGLRPCGKYGCHENFVGFCQFSGEFMEIPFQACVTVRLEDHDKSSARIQFPHRFQRSGKLRRMVCVILDQQLFLSCGTQTHPPFDAGKGTQCLKSGFTVQQAVACNRFDRGHGVDPAIIAERGKSRVLNQGIPRNLHRIRMTAKQTGGFFSVHINQLSALKCKFAEVRHQDLRRVKVP